MQNLLATYPDIDGVYGNAIYLDIPFIDSSNVEEVAKEMDGQPGHYSHTHQLSIGEAEALFKE
jgi:ribose transport system substrate-binding protein